MGHGGFWGGMKDDDGDSLRVRMTASRISQDDASMIPAIYLGAVPPGSVAAQMRGFFAFGSE
jgi:hypothetical protein